MPRIAAAWALVVGCSFDANYGGGHYKCSDGACPTGLVCTAGTCVMPGAIDAPGPDTPPAALTCSDPGLVGSGGTFAGDTTSRANTITGSCAGGIMNGNNTVYRIDTTVGDQITIAIAASWAATAYVIAPCSTAPATPACLGSSAATPGNPLAHTAALTGSEFIVVDALSPTSDGAYTLTVTR